MSDRAERLLEEEMRDIYRRAVRELKDYRPTYFLRMVNELGGLTAAKRLLQDERPSEGFATLLMHRRLDLTLEALVVRPEFASLFTGDELDRARSRLVSAGYVTPSAAAAAL